MPTATLEEKRPSTCTVLNGYVDTAYLCRLFKRSSLTIGLWRKHEGLPYILLPGDARDAIRFVRTDVVAWAKRTGHDVYLVPRTEQRV